MKLCGFIQVYNELEQGNLKRCINNLKKYCDYIVVYDDASTDGSTDYLEKEGCLVIRGEKNDFKDEIRHRQCLLDFALNKFLDIDWFFKIDADEILSREGIKKIKGICENAGKEIDGFAIEQVNLWRGYGWHRIDYYQRFFVRLWRNKPSMRYNVEYGLHHKQYPNEINNIPQITDPSIKIIHFAFLTDELLIKTYKKRVSLGGAPIEAAKMRINETNLQLSKVNLNWFPEDVEIGNTEKPVKKFFGVLNDN